MRLLEKLAAARQQQLDEAMLDATAPFHGVVEIDGGVYLKMGNLLERFDATTLRQMDVKMGVRCFEERELASSKPRADLFERLMNMAPLAATAEERAARTITKARWMQLRDQMSSTRDLGFRVDAIVTPTVRRMALESDLWRAKEEESVRAALRGFLPAPTDADAHHARQVAASVLEQLVRASRHPPTPRRPATPPHHAWWRCALRPESESSERPRPPAAPCRYDDALRSMSATWLLRPPRSPPRTRP